MKTVAALVVGLSLFGTVAFAGEKAPDAFAPVAVRVLQDLPDAMFFDTGELGGWCAMDTVSGKRLKADSILRVSAVNDPIENRAVNKETNFASSIEARTPGGGTVIVLRCGNSDHPIEQDQFVSTFKGFFDFGFGNDT